MFVIFHFTIFYFILKTEENSKTSDSEDISKSKLNTIINNKNITIDKV